MKTFALQSKIDYDAFRIYGLIADAKPSQLAFFCNRVLDCHLQLDSEASEKAWRCMYAELHESCNDELPMLVHLIENENRNPQHKGARKSRCFFGHYTELNYFLIFQNAELSLLQTWVKILQALSVIRFIYPLELKTLKHREVLESLRV